MTSGAHVAMRQRADGISHKRVAGEPGLRLIAQLASHDPNLPAGVIDIAVAKWMHGGKHDWHPGYIDGPVQQLTLMAVYYQSARDALRTIARDEWTYSEDAAYAAQGLARVGLESEARAFSFRSAETPTLIVEIACWPSNS